MSEWKDKSDFEINKAVALTQDEDGDIEKVTKRESKIKSLSSIALIKFKGYTTLDKFNPCNNPSDAWSIIVENKISLVYMCDEWEAHALENQDEAFNTQDKKPLRAAMICYLEMNGVKP